MITVSLLSLSPETMQRMQDQEQRHHAPETACRPWERVAAVLIVCGCIAGATLAAFLPVH